MSEQTEVKPVLELRIVLTAQDYDRLVEFYTASLGVNPATAWSNAEGRGTIFEISQATLELVDEQQAGTIDQIEAGQRISGPIRLALRVSDLAHRPSTG